MKNYFNNLHTSLYKSVYLMDFNKKMKEKSFRFAFFLKSVYLIATRDLSNLWLQFFLSQNQGFMRLFEKTVLK